ncbi:hypothetical protein [Variovorax sp. PAMC26660]|uniref:hypothetical protein n=1 Tax=Variovorax sp. PAMC26660 TaxID=2762322 RepID=UPI00164D69EA|nr:hypothetical protein [Variovorax sp. PAMC26660]QNK65813.1 hypothetical protein H7F35_21685 [Variovorax sp. PAMC26660]
MIESDAIVYLSVSFAALVEHNSRCGNGVRPSFEMRYALADPGVLHAQLWWLEARSAVAASFLWDYVEFDIGTEPSHAVAQRLASSLPEGRLGKRPAEVVENWSADSAPMFSVHPQRFRMFHPAGESLARSAGRHSRPQDVFTVDVQNKIASLISSETQKDFSKTRLSLRLANTRAWPRKEADGYTAAMFNVAFHAGGRQIFQFPPRLMEMFDRTDVDDLPLESLNFPYEALYLSFGPQPELEAEPGWQADGAYVFCNHIRQKDGSRALSFVQFCVTFAPVSDPDAYGRLGENPEPFFVIAFADEALRMGIGEASDFEISNRVARLRKERDGATGFAEQARQIGMPSAQAVSAKSELEHLPQLRECWARITRLIVNALAYLSAYPDDVDARWPSDAPGRLVEKSSKATDTKEQRQAKTELAMLGYTEIHLCGKSFEENFRQEAAGNSAPRGAHWVRGHWVRQAYGPTHSLRRLQWRRPHRRNVDAKADEIAGHVYRVENVEQSK